MSDSHLMRGYMLFGQDRYELAEKEARQALVEDPDDADAHALLSRCLAETGQFDEATAEAKLAIHLDPEDSMNHYALGMVCYERNRFPDAAKSFQESIELDPDDPEGYAMLALVKYRQKDWSGSLAASEEALALDPEHEASSNARSLALLRLGRLDEAAAGMEGQLEQTPNSAITHASMGWTLLEAGQPHEALEHFREALRLEPEMQLARTGIVEALKARNIIYRWLLGFGFWLSRFSETMQWGIIIGFYFGYRTLSRFAAANPEWSPWVQPLLWLYFGFAMLTWFGDPIFNLLLRLNPTGRHALTREQTIAANWVGILVGPAVLMLIVAGVLGDRFLPLCALVFAIMGFSVSCIFDCEVGWPRTWMIRYTILVGLLGLPILLLRPLVLIGNLPLLMICTMLFGITRYPFLVTAFMLIFVSNWLSTREPKL